MWPLDTSLPTIPRILLAIVFPERHQSPATTQRESLRRRCAGRKVEANIEMNTPCTHCKVRVSTRVAQPWGARIVQTAVC